MQFIDTDGRRAYRMIYRHLREELVDWFNMVDATYRSEPRELNEFNYARFDSKLEQRTAELKAEFKTRIAELETHLTKRMFGFWVAQTATNLAFLFGVLKLLH